MNHLFIPPLGTEIVLAAPWTFKLYNEYRNDNAILYFGLPLNDHWHRGIEETFQDVTFPIGTILKVDRIYIRKGGSDFDSVTFFMKGGNKIVPFTKGKQKAIRFWAKLSDVNKIMMED